VNWIVRGRGVLRLSSRNWQSQPFLEHEVHVHALLAGASATVAEALTSGAGKGALHSPVVVQFEIRSRF
jgi:hypothetical protein